MPVGSPYVIFDDPERAEKHFAALTASVSAPISLARGYYWMGRAAEARGVLDLANRRYAQAAEHRYTYYGQLAAEKIGGEALMRRFESIATASAADKALFSSRPIVAALKILSDLEDDRTFLIFSYHADDQLETPGEYLELADLAARIGATHASVRAGKVSVKRKAFAPEVSYPVVFVPDEATRFAPAEVILGLSRQESEFNPRAYSRAGARGLMQLIPSTAKITARKERLRYSRSALLDDPIYNMTIGSAHLSHLFDKYDGSYIMTFAAYNAGASRVTQWVERYGDPRSANIDPLDWVENIPFSETRNYVQRVLENTQVYRSIFDEQPIPGRLSGDLERGGSAKRVGALPARKSVANLPDIPARILEKANSTLLETPVPILPQPAPVNAVPTTEQPKPAPATAAQITPSSLSEDLIATTTADPAGEKIQQITAAAEQSSQVEILTEPIVTLDAVGASAQPKPVASEILQKSPTPKPDSAVSGVTPISKIVEAPPTTAEPAKASDCQTYVEFIAETGQEEASAADLNAGVLAELRGGGSACE